MVKNYLVNSKTQGKILLVDGIIFGRSKGCHIPIDDKNLSKEHIRITLLGERVAISDLDSSGGTKVNGLTLTPNSPVTLKIDDKVEMGSQVFIFKQIISDLDNSLKVVREKKSSVAENEIESESTSTRASVDLNLMPELAGERDSRSSKALKKYYQGKDNEDGALECTESLSRPKRKDRENRIPKTELSSYSSNRLAVFLKEQKEYVLSLQKYAKEISDKKLKMNDLEKSYKNILKEVSLLKIQYEMVQTSDRDNKFKIYKSVENQIQSLQRQMSKLLPDILDYKKYFSLLADSQKMALKIKKISELGLKKEQEVNNQMILLEQKYLKEIESQHSKNTYFEQQKKREEDIRVKADIQDEIDRLQEKMKKLE